MWSTLNECDEEGAGAPPPASPASPYLGCQLAHDFESKRVTYPVAVEPKLDGFRVTFVNGEGYTRNGKTYESFRPFAEILHAIVGPGVHVDCEMMAGNWNETSKLLKRIKKVDHDRIRNEVTCHIFDVFDAETIGSEPYTERRRAVEWVASKTSTGCGDYRFRATDKWTVCDEEQLNAAYESWVAKGFEGIMVKSLDGVYTLKRTRAWMKLKPEKDFTVMIVRAEHAWGGCPGCTLETKVCEPAECGQCEGVQEVPYYDRLGALICVMDDGRPVRVGGGYTLLQRTHFWAQRDSLVGKKIDVVGQDESGTSNEVTIRFPRFVRFREDLS